MNLITEQPFKRFSNKINCVIAIVKTKKKWEEQTVYVEMIAQSQNIVFHSFKQGPTGRLQMNPLIAQWDSLYILNVQKNLSFQK